MSKQARLLSLQRQHSELETEIESREASKVQNSLDIWTLKRKKLALKEQIEAIKHRR